MDDFDQRDDDDIDAGGAWTVSDVMTAPAPCQLQVKEDRRLSDEVIIDHLVRGRTQTQAGQAGGRGERTGRRRLQDPEFLERLGQARQDYALRQRALSEALENQATAAIEQLLGPDVDAGIRDQSARSGSALIGSGGTNRSWAETCHARGSTRWRRGRPMSGSPLITVCVGLSPTLPLEPLSPNSLKSGFGVVVALAAPAMLVPR